MEPRTILHHPRWASAASRARPTLTELFAQDPRRFEELAFTLPLGPSGSILVDLSKQPVTLPLLAELATMAEESGLLRHRDAMFSGEPINRTEGRAVLHTALRHQGGKEINVDGKNVMPEVLQVREQMRRAANAVRSGQHLGFTGKPIRSVVNIGIGGSDLGPLMVCEALKPYAAGGPEMFFVSNVDGTHLAEVLRRVDPETTLFLIASKTFTTQETLENARSARSWFLERARDEAHIAAHFFALSTNEAEVTRFGIARENMFPFWDWVGGRYSLWSAIGLSIAMAVGPDAFEELLLGASLVDTHFLEAPPLQNLPILLGLIGVFDVNVVGAVGHAVLPYDQYLHRFPAYLQQADMESNGKSVDFEGHPVAYPTGPILFGEPGTNGQHAFYQLIHQGTSLITCDFLVAAKSHNPLGRHHDLLVANVLAQSEALLKGKTFDEAYRELEGRGLSEEERARLARHKTFTGNRPSTVFVYDKLDPRTLGALIALYEHRVFVMGSLWGINSFDQWGVELGKQLAQVILPELEGRSPISEAHDASTRGLIKELRSRMGRS